MNAEDYVVVGRIGPAHGLRGEVFVEPRTDEPERRFAPGAVLQTAGGTLSVAASRTHSGRLVVRFAELADRNAAEEAPVETPSDESPVTSEPAADADVAAAEKSDA